MADANLENKRSTRKRPLPSECRRGHLYTDADFKPNGERECRLCKKMRANARRAETGVWQHKPRDLQREQCQRRAKLEQDLVAKARVRESQRKWQEKAMSDPARREAERIRKLAISKRRYRTDPSYRLRLAVMRRLRETLRSSKGEASWFKLVGYNLQDLKVHLERQFTKGMTWENYGKWHVDHIVPVASFTFQTTADPGFKDCWSLTNLQPLWALDNKRKSGTRTHLI